jgi:TPP-dependent pyruvate/acetoin dehydrogenase alpha subunit
LVYSLNKKHLLKIFQTFYLIRSTEFEISKRYKENKMRCPTHLSIGQEAVPSVLSLFLTKDNPCVSTHRGHAHYLSKGGDLNKMIAEIYGKATGCSKGKGGSMHLIDKKVGFFGTSAIVGNSLPIGAGLSYNFKLNNKKKLFSVIFLGDGSIEEGSFYETINLCATMNLPVLFVCENNLYSVYSPLSVRQPKGRDNVKMINEIGINSFRADGNNVSEIFKTFKKAINYIQEKAKPCFVEFSNYRWLEHCGPNYDNELGYRKKSEYLKWKKRDCFERLRNNLKKFYGKKKILELEKKINIKIIKAFNFAENSPFPKKDEIYKDIFK